MKTWLIAMMLASSVAIFATPAQAQELPTGLSDQMHCTIPYPIDPCLADYVTWLLSIHGPVNLVCQLATGEYCIGP